jgi:hypothetical protein
VQDVKLALALLDDTPACTIFEALSLTEAGYGSVRRYYIQADQDNLLNLTTTQFITNNNPPESVFTISSSDSFIPSSNLKS